MARVVHATLPSGTGTGCGTKAKNPATTDSLEHITCMTCARAIAQANPIKRIVDQVHIHTPDSDVIAIVLSKIKHRLSPQLERAIAKEVIKQHRKNQKTKSCSTSWHEENEE